jgi:hypothetical protein
MIMCKRIKTKEIVLPMGVVLLWVGLVAGQGGGMVGGGGAGGGMAGGGVYAPPLSANFVPLWDTIGLSVTLSQAQDGLDGLMGQPAHALCITGVIDVLDSEYVMGISTNNMKTTRVLNESKQGVQCNSSFNARIARTYQALRGPEPFTVQLNLDPAETWPLELSSLECEVHAMYAQGHEMFEIPFAASDQWIELKPGISVWVDQAQGDGIDYSYLLRIRYEGADPTLFDAYRYVTHLPDDMVMGIQLLDPEGVPVAESDVDSIRIGNLNIRTGEGTGADVQTLQFKLATEPHEEKITLVLTDLPVPTL